MSEHGERAMVDRRAVPRDVPERPDRRWSARLLHHGLRLAVLLATAVAVYLLFPATRGASAPVLEQGVVAREDVVARIPFIVPKGADELRRERDQAASGVAPVFDLDPAAQDSVLGGLAGFFASVDSALGGATLPSEAQEVRGALMRWRVPTTLGGVEVLAEPVRRLQLRQATEAAVRELLPRGIASARPVGPGVQAVQVRGTAAGDRLLPADSVLTAESFFQAAAQRLPPELGADGAELQRLLLVRFFRPSLVPNERETAAARLRARAAVDTVKARVLGGEKVVGAREQVGEREYERLRAYRAALDAAGDGTAGGHSLGRALGSVLYNFLLLGIVGVLLYLSRRRLYADRRAVFFLAFLVVAVAALAAVIARTDAPHELIPVPFAAMVVAVLWGGRLALALVLVLAVLLGGQTPFLGVEVAFSAAVAGAAAAFGVRLAERRVQTWMVVGVIAAAYAATALSLGLLRAEGWGEIGWSALWGLANATASSLLGVGFLPVAEWFTRVTTNQTLMELADPKHPLLRRLSMEAPGTYAHTISVANLAEAVCNAIGANALLARVGVYYHDIGKIAKPHYFIENQPRGRNPHDKLKPGTSAAIVRSHVAEGLRLAEEHRLPEAVKAFIAQHHGTQTISFFLDQAKAADPNAQLNPADYRYHGPRPQTRETAVAMLADSVESAARVLQDPTPQRVRELVERIVNAKIAGGQLDQSPLTLREIHTAKEVLAKALIGMYHHRLDYAAPPNGGAAKPAPGPAPADAAPTVEQAVETSARAG